MKQALPGWEPDPDPSVAIANLEEEGNFDRVNAGDNRMLDPGSMQRMSKHELERKRRRDMVRPQNPEPLRC